MTPTYPTDDVVKKVAQALKRLYPQNPDIVIGREARTIIAYLDVRLVEIDNDGAVTDAETGEGYDYEHVYKMKGLV